MSPPVALFEKRNHVERAVSVLYVLNCAKMVATIFKLPLCREELPVLIEGQNVSSIGHFDPFTKVLYHNNTMQPTVSKCHQFLRRQFSTKWRNAEKIQA